MCQNTERNKIHKRKASLREPGGLEQVVTAGRCDSVGRGRFAVLEVVAGGLGVQVSGGQGTT